MSQIRPSQPSSRDGNTQPSIPAVPSQPLPPYAQPQHYQQFPNTGYPQWQQPPQLPQRPPKLPNRNSLSKYILVAIMFVLLLVGGLVVRQYIGGMPLPVASTSPSDQQTTVAYEQTNTAAQTTAAVQMTAYAQSPIATAPQVSPTPPPPTYLTFGDGTYRVGADIKAGTYRTQQGSQSCYYARLSGFGGITSDIIANNLTDYPAIVTISPTDKGFESQNCGTWTSDLSQITTSKTSFDDGIYIIGTDIAPGTYKDTGGNGCYYARLSGFGTTTGDIIANNLANAPSIITISASDKGFQTQGCGTWTKI